MQPFIGALMFALTRPKINVSAQPRSLQAWKFLWDQCATSVAEAGLDVGLWARSESYSSVDGVEGFEIRLSFLSDCMKIVSQDPGLWTRKRLGITLEPDPEVGIVTNEGFKISELLVVSLHSFDNAGYECTADAVAVTADDRFVLVHLQCHMDAFSRPRNAIGLQCHCDSVVLDTAAFYWGTDLMRALDLANSKSASSGWTIMTPGCLGVFCLPEKPDGYDYVVCRTRVGKTRKWLVHSLSESCGFKNAETIIRRSWQRVQRTTLDKRPCMSTHRVEPHVCLENVIEVVSHLDPPAVRDTSLLQLQADEEWAADVERHLQQSQLSECQEQHVEQEDSGRIILLQYKSHPHEFLVALTTGVALRACRDALTAEHRHFILPDSGTKVFIKPEQWQVVMTHIQGRELRPYHVIVAEEYEHLVTECLKTIPFRRRPKLKPRIGRMYLSHADDSDIVLGEPCELGDFVPILLLLSCSRHQHTMGL